MLEQAIKAARMAFWLLAVSLLFEAHYAIQYGRGVMDTTAGELRTQLRRQSDSLAVLQTSVAGTVTKAETDLNARLSDFNSTADYRLGEANFALAGTGVGLVYELDSFNRSAAAAVAGFRDVTAHSSQIESQISEAWPDLFSRYLAITGEAMRTMDSSRRMMGELERATPLFLQRTDILLNQGGGIATDIHAATSRFLRPQSTKAKIWDGMKLGAAVAGRFAP